MARTPVLTRDNLPEQFQEAFDHETANSGGVVASGPGSAMINSPEMRRRCNHLADYLRLESSLPDRIQQLAMLITARATDCQFIWNAHAARGRQAGLSDALVDAIRDRQPLPSVPPDEAAVVQVGTEFFNNRKVSQEAFQAGVDQFGAQGLTELTTLIGYYALLAINANTFLIDLPNERSEPILPI